MFITKSNRLLRKILIIVSFLTVYAVIFSISDSSAYWIDSVTTPEEEVISMEIQIGEWDFDDDGKGPPELEPQPYDDYNLNEWIENNALNQTVEAGIFIIYNDKLHLTIASYNPQSNGLPGEPSSTWAVLAISLEWNEGSNYRENSVITKEGRWFIGRPGQSWLVDDPLGPNSWAWMEIMPLSEDDFKDFPNSTIRDYTKPKDPNDIVPK